MAQNKKQRILASAIYLAVFFFFVVWFFSVHPIRMIDTDDWTYLSLERDAIPKIRVWNPTRIFAETVYPTVSQISAVVFTPLVGGVLDALTLGWSICVAGAITLLFATLRQTLIKKAFLLSGLCCCLFNFW